MFDDIVEKNKESVLHSLEFFTLLRMIISNFIFDFFLQLILIFQISLCSRSFQYINCFCFYFFLFQYIERQ